ncbi:unnamed protein product [Brachionus calyciflorus]|uniref:Uncharacterized protein n=1 Tax=Brachionus calyciflorus TaxID=104777 RepID=A0A813UGL5_9BILA|nr:unnamed protein product [Brachionus calyciflorus]
MTYDIQSVSLNIETIAHPKERKQLIQNIDIRIILLSVIAGVILLILLTIVLWCCGFFKRFEPNEESKSKLSETSTSDEDISSSNDVIDVSKDLTRTENENRENINLLPSANPSYALGSVNSKQPLLGVNSYTLNNKNNEFNHKLPLYSNSKVEYTNFNTLIKSDEIYGFTPLNQIMKSETNLNQLSTFQVINSSKNNTLNNHKISSNNKLINPFEKSNYFDEQQLVKKPNSKNNTLDAYTNKLPPVPRRNSKTSINNSSSNNLALINNTQKNLLNNKVINPFMGVNNNRTESTNTNIVLKSKNIEDQDFKPWKKKEKVRVAQQNISSYHKDKSVKKESSDQDTDEEPDLDNGNKENMEYNATTSRSCEYNTKICPCVNHNKQKCTSLYHLNSVKNY